MRYKTFKGRMFMYSELFINEIPKTDLHLHLDGSIRLNTLIEIAKSRNIPLPSYDPVGLREKIFKEKYNNLSEYLHGFTYTCEILRDQEALEQCAYELAIDNQKEGVRYIEVRFAPQLFINNKELNMENVFQSINRGLQKATRDFNQRQEVTSQEEPPFNYGLIACAMRKFGSKSYSPYYGHFFDIHQFSTKIEVIKLAALDLAKAVIKIRNEKGIPIVGFDIAGQEDGFPAKHFTEAFNYIHKNYMHKTVHAGEAYGAESIFQAITSLHADRLGHSQFLFDFDRIQDPSIVEIKLYIDRLVNYIAEKRITIEVCLTSNLQTNPSLKHISDHALKNMIIKKIPVTFCTDNRLISNTTIPKEITLALNHFDISAKKLKSYIINGFKKSFYPGSYLEKREYTDHITRYYEKICKKYKIQ